MANRYWVGGTADWNGTALLKWATTSGGIGGAAVPTLSDDVFFDGNSGAVTVTLGANVACRKLDFTGFTSGTFAMGANHIDINGDVILNSSLVFTSSSGAYLNFQNAGNNLLTSNGVNIPVGIFIGNGFSTTVFQLVDNLICTDTFYGINLVDGTFDANNKNVTCAKFSSSHTNGRAIIMGSGTWSLTGTGTVWDCSTLTNATINANTSTIKLTNNSSSAKTFIGGATVNGGIYNNFWNATLGSGIVTINNGNTFNNIKIDAGRTQQFSSGSDHILSSLTALGTFISPITIQSDTTSQHNLIDTSGTNTVDYCIIAYSNASGGATFNATNSTDGGNNTGWNFISASNNGSGFLDII